MFHRQDYYQTEREQNDTALARGLGWFSIGIGLAELVMPRQIENLLGLDHDASTRGTIRALGARELCHGAAILTEDRPSPELRNAMWARVAGDVLDTTLFGMAGTKTRSPGGYAMAGAMLMAVGAADFICAKRLTEDA